MPPWHVIGHSGGGGVVGLFVGWAVLEELTGHVDPWLLFLFMVGGGVIGHLSSGGEEGR
jgi:hypothetical protein